MEPVKRESRHYMQRVLTIAEDALGYGEFPIASILVLDDQVLTQASTMEVREGRFLVHAEYAVLAEADEYRLSVEERIQAVLYTNLEPCLMCMGAAMSFFLGEIIYGLESPGDGAVDLVRSWRRVDADFPGYRVPKITGGVLRDQSIALFQKYVETNPPGPRRDWAATLARL
jgi:tRNA(adenine34) deaminase